MKDLEVNLRRLAIENNFYILGTSQIYGSSARRPSPAILDQWPNGWRHSDLLPYFKKMEDHYCYYDNSNITGISAEECRTWHGKYVQMSILRNFASKKFMN